MKKFELGVDGLLVDVEKINEIDLEAGSGEVEVSNEDVSVVYEVTTGFRDAVYNKIASEFIVNNYERLVKGMYKFGVNEHFGSDLLNDLFISIVSKEEAGEGYDESTGITVDEYVFGCIKGYAKNIKYKEVGELKYKKKKGADADDDKEVIGSFASSTTGSEESLSGIQMAFMNARDDRSENDFDESDAYMDLVNDVNMCLEFGDRVNMDLKVFFKNIEMFVDEVQGRNRTMFNKLFDTLKLHSDFELSFVKVMEMYNRNKEVYMDVMNRI